MEKTFGSTCHGAGRVMSRAKAKKMVRGGQFTADSFRHLADGRLFQLENDSPAAASKATEYFWLCSRCSAAMTLGLVHDGNVVATELPQAHDESRSHSAQ
jgi:RNA-splicing ligase RtcB